jgi:hypothetical protein
MENPKRNRDAREHPDSGSKSLNLERSTRSRGENNLQALTLPTRANYRKESNKSNYSDSNLSEDGKANSITNTAKLSSKATVKCHTCKKLEHKELIFKCFACKIEKCQKCAGKDCQANRQKLRGTHFICEVCFRNGERLRTYRKRVEDETRSPDKSFEEDAEDAIFEKIEKEGSSGFSGFSGLVEGNRNEKNEKPEHMLKRKRAHTGGLILTPKKTQNKVDKEANVDLHAGTTEINKEYEPETSIEMAETTLLLDLDKIYTCISPPNEIERSNLLHSGVKLRLSMGLVEQNDDAIMENSEPLNLDPNNIGNDYLDGKRKSERSRKAIETISVINCHECKKIETTVNILTCGEELCRESFCIRCVKKYFVS